VDPVRDLQIISDELIAKDKQIVDAAVDATQKIVLRNGADKLKKDELETLLKVQAWLNQSKDVRDGEWNMKDVDILSRLGLLTGKPIAFLINLSAADYIAKKNKWLKPIADWVAKRTPGSAIVPFSGAFEQQLVDMDEEKRVKFVEEQKATTQIPKIITTGYHTLDLIHFFTSGSDEVRAWTIRKGCKAPQAAGVIHTDFERGFIAAEVMAYDDFKALGSENAVKAAGKYKTQGKLYTMVDGDIVFFKFNVSGGKQAKK